MTSFGCTLWGSELDSTTATNTGGTREQFQVVITGSNGYDKTNSSTPIISSPSSSTTATSTLTTLSTVTKSATTTTSKQSCPTSINSNPTNCHSGAISAPSHWLGSRFIPGPFNPSLCASYAVKQNVVNQVAAAKQGLSTYSTCSMFNAYYLHKNGVPAGTVCALFDTTLDSSYATLVGGTSPGGDDYDCHQSWIWTLS